MIGSLTGYVDVAQVTLYAFFIFFAGIVYYCRREDKREGYPLEAEIGSRGPRLREGFPFTPRPKTFLLHHGGIYRAPNGRRDPPPAHARPVDAYPGSPLQPTGDPMLDAVGPASYAERRDEPETLMDGKPMIVPMRFAERTHVDVEDADPRGMPVVGADGIVAGTVFDLWVDRAEPQIRYLEVALGNGAPAAGSAEGPRTVLLPIPFARISQRRRRVKVSSVLARHFATVPRIKNPAEVTKLEEDRITAYFASGHLYAKPSRLGPWL